MSVVMFAGIIEKLGTVVAVETTPGRQAGAGGAHRLDIDLGVLAEGLQRGASVAVNGACLTLSRCRGTVAGFDVVPETWGRTTLARLRVGDAVNLERSLRVGDRIDGHFVQGHVDGTGVVERVDRKHGAWKLWVRTEPALMAAVVPKGSIALDGTSLTVVDVHDERFSVALVPTTLEQTVLGHRAPGDPVNIETDILARVLIQRLEAVLGASRTADGAIAGLTWEKLREGGFVR